MYKLIRLLLILTVLLGAYCTFLVTLLVPWAWAALAVGALIGLARRGYRYTAFGTSRWADMSDLPEVNHE